MAVIFLFSFNTLAQKEDTEDILMVLPAQRIFEFVTELLPFEIDMGDNFSGSLWIKSIKNFRIGIRIPFYMMLKRILYTEAFRFIMVLRMVLDMEFSWIIPLEVFSILTMKKEMLLSLLLREGK